MSIKLTKKVASDILGRGLNAIKIRIGSEEDAKKAITRDDVRKMIKEGAVYAVKKRREVYAKAGACKEEEGHRKAQGRDQGKAGKQLAAQGALAARTAQEAQVDGEDRRSDIQEILPARQGQRVR